MTVKTFEYELMTHRNVFRRLVQKGEMRLALDTFERMYDLCTNSFEEDCVMENFAEVFREELVA